MPTRNVVITDHQSQMVDKLVATGKYQNASEVLREGLRLIAARQKREDSYLAWLRGEAQVGIDEIERGDYEVFETFDAFEQQVMAETEAVIAEVEAKRPK